MEEACRIISDEVSRIMMQASISHADDTGKSRNSIHEYWYSKQYAQTSVRTGTKGK
jgi:hypothetical protein